MLPVSHPVRAFWLAEPGRGEIRSETLPAAADGDAVVRTLYSGISRGTESLVFQGRVPPSEFERMRAPFQSGEFPAPVKYGYASVGEIERGPRELEGRRGFVLYPHQTKYVVPAAAIYLLPPSVPADRAVLAANMETAINGVWDAGVKPGDHVVVIGGGAVGCLAAWLVARIPGSDGGSIRKIVDQTADQGLFAQATNASFNVPAREIGPAGGAAHCDLPRRSRADRADTGRRFDQGKVPLSANVSDARIDAPQFVPGRQVAQPPVVRTVDWLGARELL